MKQRFSLLVVAVLACGLVSLSAQANNPGPSKVTGKGTTTLSGLQYWDLAVGKGTTALPGSRVQVNYTGWLTTGKQFDSSVGRRPFEFTIGNKQVIKGWEEGVAGM